MSTDKDPRNIDNLLSKISEHPKIKSIDNDDSEFNPINLNKDTNKLVSKILKSKKLSFSAKVLLAALITRDGLNGGKISIISAQDIIGANSVKTAIKVLTDLEKSGLIIRIRTKQFSTYKIISNIEEVL